MRISKKVAEIWLKLFKKTEIYATMLDNNVKYNYRKAVTQYMNRFELVVPCHFGLEAVVKREIYDLGYMQSEYILERRRESITSGRTI